MSCPASRPERPSPLRENVSFWWFRTFGPHLPRIDQPDPPAALAPWETVRIERPGRKGTLAGTWYPADGGRADAEPSPARGAVLLLPPFVPWGRAYFHRRGRIQALRAAGYHALTVDFPGRGGSGPVRGFFDRDVEDALLELERRAPGLPLHVWGVSAGGYWAHMALSGRAGIRGAMFEDVSPHLMEWSDRKMPAARLFHIAFRSLFGTSDRYFDIRDHAEAMGLRRVSYVSGALDDGVRPEDTRELAARAGGRAWIVDEADHLEAIKRVTDRVIAMALETFADAEGPLPPLTRGPGTPAPDRSGP